MAHTLIFIGRSGCGKGTQAKLIMDYINAQNPEAKIFYMESGARFREFIKGESLSSKLSKEIYDADLRQPDFLAIWNWSHLFVENLTGDENLFIDGTPRSLAEAQILHTAMTFYKREKPFVIHLNVSKEWSEKHLLSRGRGDDGNLEKIDKRLKWFETDVVPAINYYKSHPEYRFFEVNGEQTIEKVNQDIMSFVV